LTPNEAAKHAASNSSTHDVNGKNSALMARQQIIDKIAND
jgi:hypothetical protein